MALLDYSKTVKAIGEMQNTNTWLIQFTLGGGITMSDDVKFRCVTSNLPTQEFTDKEATINRFKITQPGTTSRNGTIELTFLESEDGNTAKLFDQLDKARFSMDSNNVTGLSKGWLNLKGTVIMTMQNSKGQNTQQYKLVDCSFKPDYSTELGNDDAVYQPKLTVAYNWWFKIL